jgi:hypothetical protein
MALTYGELSSITQNFLVPKLVDNVFDSNVLLSRARKKWYEKGSGLQVQQPLAYATTTAAGRFSGADTLNNTPNDQVTAATWDWKQYYASIQITRLDELKNSGKEAVINLVKSKVQLAEKSLASLMGTDLFAAGTTANSIVGVKGICAGSGTTYGNISKTDYSWWRGQQDTTTTAITYPKLRDMLGNLSIDNDKPSLIITTKAIYSDIVALLQPQQRFTDAKTADAGFQNVLVEGLPVVQDSHCPSGYIYLLNESYITLYYLEDFRFDPFTKPINQAVSVAHIFWTGALACSNCRLQGEFSAIA